MDILLGHPPRQGRYAFDRLRNYLVSSGFSANPKFLIDTFLGSTQSATRWHIVDLVSKHAVLEIDTGVDMLVTAEELANRSPIRIRAFATADRQLVLSALAKAMGRVQAEDGGKLLRALGRLGDM